MYDIPNADAYGVVIFNAKGQVLLREPSGHFGGYVWTFAKGRPDAGESPAETAVREAFEETGYRIAAPRKLGTFLRFTFMPEYDLWAEKLCHIYLAQPVRPHGPPREPGHMAIWMSPTEALSELYNDGDAAFVARHA